jgi:hypothetical protein
MSRTVDRLGNQLTAKNLFNALLDKADENGIDAKYLIDGARRNPMALGLIAAGAIWLVSDKDSKFPTIHSGKSKTGAAGSGEFEGDYDVHHRDYVAHMGALDMRDGEDELSYQRRRDLHRANFLMCERNPGEDDHSFRQRLNDLTDKFREKRSAWSDSASQTASTTSRKARQTAREASAKAQNMYASNPLVGGILAAAVGAALGSTIPVSRQEQEKLGPMGAKARDMASEQKEQLTSTAMEKKDEMLEKVDEKLQPRSAGAQGSPPAQGSQQDAGMSDTGGERHPSSDGPFIISERSF